MTLSLRFELPTTKESSTFTPASDYKLFPSYYRLCNRTERYKSFCWVFLIPNCGRTQRFTFWEAPITGCTFDTHNHDYNTFVLNLPRIFLYLNFYMFLVKTTYSLCLKLVVLPLQCIVCSFAFTLHESTHLFTSSFYFIPSAILLV